MGAGREFWLARMASQREKREKRAREKEEQEQQRQGVQQFIKKLQMGEIKRLW